MDWLLALLLRVALGAALWYLLTHGVVSSWLVGLPTVGAAAAASLALLPPGTSRLRPPVVGRFLLFFFRMSLLGAVDVSARVLHPRMPLHPAMIEYRTDLPEGPARVVFIGTINLLPGTLVADVQLGALRVHVLDREMPVLDELRRLEALVTGLVSVRSARGRA